jgi:hypothetical protein
MITIFVQTMPAIPHQAVFLQTMTQMFTAMAVHVHPVIIVQAEPVFPEQQ